MWESLPMDNLHTIVRSVVKDLDERSSRYTVVSPGSVDETLRRLFIDHLGQLLGEAEEDVRRMRFDRLCKHGHSIKGMGGSCGAPEISVAGEELEKAALAKDDDRCVALLAAMRVWIQAAAGG
jgi:hypothetical protein